MVQLTVGGPQVSMSIVAEVVLKWLLSFPEARKFLATFILFGIVEVCLVSPLGKWQWVKAAFLIDQVATQYSLSWKESKKVQGFFRKLMMLASGYLIMTGSMECFFLFYSFGPRYSNNLGVMDLIQRAVRLGFYNACQCSFTRNGRNCVLKHIANIYKPEAILLVEEELGLANSVLACKRETDEFNARDKEISDLLQMDIDFLHAMNNRKKNTDANVKAEVNRLAESLGLSDKERLQLRQMCSKTLRKKVIELLEAHTNYIKIKNQRLRQDLHRNHVKNQLDLCILKIQGFLLTIVGKLLPIGLMLIGMKVYSELIRIS